MLGAAALLLGCSGPPTPEDTEVPEETGGPPAARREWVDVTPYPCGIDADGWVVCWSSAGWAEVQDTDPASLSIVPDSPFQVRRASVDFGAVAHGQSLDGTATRVWSCYSLAVQDPESSIWCIDPPDLDWDALGVECGLADGAITCFGGGNSAPFPEPEGWSYRLFHGPYSNSYAGLTTDNRIIIRGTVELEFALPTSMTVETLASFRGGACVLTSVGEVACFGGSITPAFTHPPYRMLQAGDHAVCAVRDDWTIECQDGSTFDFGPIRALSVYTHIQYVPIDPPADGSPPWEPRYAQSTDRPHICVVTEDNAVRCEGWRYDFDDLQAQLPKGDAP
ncbi:MAG: hypothetical protein R3F61_12715 [Myxococcota bacterium]